MTTHSATPPVAVAGTVRAGFDLLVTGLVPMAAE